jgi:DNA-binding CsgD family transcriptional regulator
MTKRPSNFDIDVDPVSEPINQPGDPLADRVGLPNDLLTAVNSLNLGILIADGDGRIKFANQVVEDTLLSHPSLICPAGRRSENPRSGDTQERRLSRSIGSRIQASGHDRLMLQVHGKQPLLVVVLRHPERASGTVAGSSSILFISELAGPQHLDCSPVACLYGLTRAETKLLDALLKGEKITAYARRASITINTVKGHLSRLFRKTQTSRQSELVLRILSNPIFRVLLVPTVPADRPQA